MLNPCSKVKVIDELKDLVQQAQKMGKSVVFANGCFDLIHVGHIRYLEGAKAHGDMLIVGINSDASVKRIKGRGRPLQSQEERCEIMGSFECVDYIAVFDEPTVDTLLLNLKPNIHAKGTDYTKESVPERDTVISYGGKVAIVGDAKSHSSRDLIKDILSRFCQ
jgi:D-glycero-beta-D-manno-heptose 1-phosphate adenylyltransferase